MTWENRLTFEVLGDVRNSNPYFETDASGWTGKGGSLVRSTAQFHEGVATGLLTPTGVNATTEAESNSVPVIVTAPYRLSAWVQCAVARNITLNINWFSTSGYLSTSSATPVAVLANTWTLLSFTPVSIPATAATATGLVSMTGTPPATNTLYFDEAILTNADESGQVWVDLTTRIRDQLQPVTSQSGRQNDLDQAEPGRLDLLLENSDDALTYGNTASVYPWWGPGRKCRLRETVAGVVMDRFTGYLQMPTEVLITAPVDPADSREQRVAITAVDQLGRPASDEPFISTLGAHIANSGNGVLTGYWTLLERSLPFRPVVGGLAARVELNNGFEVPGPVDAFSTTPAGGDAVLADDASPVLLTPGRRGSATSWILPYIFAAGSTPMAAGEVATVVLWVKTDLSTDPAISAMSFGWPGGFMNLRRQLTASGGTWRLDPNAGVLNNGNVDSDTAAASGRYTMLGIRFGYSPNVLELWVDDRQYIATMTGTFVGSMAINNLTAGSGVRGSIAYLQLYVGAPAAWGFAEFTAQRAIALYGLERQTTGDRIRTIAQYAGIPAAELTQIDTGSSVMQRATLAGKTPLQAMRDAERTERGLLYVDGSGNLVFKDRRTLYNI